MAFQLFKIFRVGTHTTMAGETMTFTAGDIQKTAAFYKPSRKVAPLVLGHPSDDQPVMGTVTALHAKGDFLFAEADVFPALTDLVRGGKYVSVSAAFHRPDGDPKNPVPGVWSLRHVGFLGARRPAVKGLGPLEFAEPEADMLSGDALAASFLDLHGGCAQVNFAEGVHGMSRLQRHREALNRAAGRVSKEHPEFTYIDAVRILEAVNNSRPS